MTKNIEYYI